MNRVDYFIAAANYSGSDRPSTKKHWVISMLAKLHEEPDDWLKHPYPYRIVRKDDGYYFVNPSADFTLTLIEGRDPDKQLFTPASKISLKAGAIKNLAVDIETTFGDALFNVIVLVYAFGNKVSYIAGKADARKLEAMIEKRFTDNPQPGEIEDPSKIYVYEYLRFTKAMMQLQGYNYLLVPSASPKALTTDPRIPEVIAKFLEENKDRSTDPAVIAQLEKIIVAMDRAHVDDDAKDFYIKSKSYDNARKKMLLMHGLEKPFDDNDDAVLIAKPLSAGMDPRKMKVYANSIREGSYNRGKETMLGGVEAKRAFRSYQNSSISNQNCGTTLGLLTPITEANVNLHINIYRQTPEGPELITEENCRSLIGTTQVIRSPMKCNTGHTDFCATCMGVKMSENPDALGAAASGVGSDFLQSFLKKMHVGNLKTVVYDMAECLS